MSGNVYSVYSAEGLDHQLRQSEIISNLVQPIFVPEQGEKPAGTMFRRHNFVVILSQDCDLLRDYESRVRGGEEILNEVLVYELEEAVTLRKRAALNSTLWKQIQPNNHERFHYLEPVPKETDLQCVGLPELLMDFRRYFSLPGREIERQLGLPSGARRRCRLEMPYREHLQTRYAFYCQRVGLPVPHTSPT
jgi:hypothetical protein